MCDVWKGPTLLRQSTLEMDVSEPVRGSACLVFHAFPFIIREGVLSRTEAPPERGTMYFFQASGI